MSNYGSTPPPPPPPSGGFQQQGYGAPLSGPTLASWIERVAAFLLDMALYLPFVVLVFVFGATDIAPTGVSAGMLLLMDLVILAVFLYNRCYKGGQGQTLGKQVLGLILVAESTGQPIGMGQAFLRDLAHLIDEFVCYIGFLFPLWDPKRQTIADKIVATVVITKA